MKKKWFGLGMLLVVGQLALTACDQEKAEPTYDQAPVEEEVTAQEEGNQVPSSQAQSSAVSQAEEAEATASGSEDGDRETYIQNLRQANARWGKRLDQAIASGLPTAQSVQAADRDPGDVHPAIAALYQKLDQELAKENHQENYRELYSDTFVLEKMLLPEFDAADQEALDQLREWLTGLVYEDYQNRLDAKWRMSQYVLDHLDFAKQMADVAALTDESFDEVNRLAVHTGVAMEAYITLINYPNFKDEIPFQADLYAHIVWPYTTDIGSTRIQAQDPATGDIWFGVPLTGDVGPKPAVDYEARYGVAITNHYPEGSAKTSTPPSGTAGKSQRLRNFMLTWGQEMGQAYQAYSPDQPADFYGAKLPQEDFEIALDGKTRQVQAGDEADDLRLLAAYSDIEDKTNPKPERHFYLFVEDKGQPRILIAEEGPDAKGQVHFKDTANQALRQGFLEIYND
ncbi:hypothetical protein CYJ28_06670 [Aerococcus sanguinicola]|uniref:DUF4767 domain-containing protein n=1 Tax=Aerococcus sanguinicola TaxID=119206 RepID=A0A2I1MN81_9LACT|nr:DUF4767 domain-containing protein [Aerococcus sanguinicola]PKZ21583.1 hypothetical protein CYJ28_06670 [Aerococcus sanguinicola]